MSLRAKLVGWAAIVALSASAFAAEVAVLSNGFTIRHQRREVMGTTTRLFFENGSQSGWIDVPTAEIASYQREEVETADASPPPTIEGIPGLVQAASDRHQVDADLVNSVIQAESGFNPRARSPKGAQGLMQLMPETASKLGVGNAWEPRDNIEGGTRYLRQLLEQYHGDTIKALAAYNAGPEHVDQYRGVPPYRETHNYVRRVIIDFNRKKVAQQKAAAAQSSSKAAKKPEPAVAETAAPRP
ncbi:MAG TPA: lytic transglycosylase domain-containing protein [Terriglobales bacterium]|nr:lytic transglycosylase domain-containing protein [Terriglobales bacterium]